MVREGKLNIWIAYSDLFSNLTTFVFISALGMMAAFGSGYDASKARNIELARSVCLKDTDDIDAVLSRKAEGSSTGFEAAKGPDQPPCSDYFSLRGYHFVPNANKPGDNKRFGSRKPPPDPLTRFVDDKEVPIAQSTMLERFCPVLFGAAVSKHLGEDAGELKIIGTASTESGLKCPLLTTTYVPLPGIKKSVSGAVLAACEDPSILAKYPTACQLVGLCKQHPMVSGCHDVNDAVRLARANASACLEERGLQRAQAIKTKCTAELSDDLLDTELATEEEGSAITDEEKGSSAKIRAHILEAWNLVHVEGVRWDPSKAGMSNLPRDGIAVEVEFHPKGGSD